MPIDDAMRTAMLGTFGDLLAGARTQGLTGADIDEMAAALAAMDTLADQLSDVGEFSTRLANDGYYTRFTDAYTRAMLAAAGGGAAAGGAPPPLPSDADLLAQSLVAYETSLNQLRTVPDQQAAVGAVERILAIGRSGISYPRFLRQVEDEALNDVLAGSVNPSRATLVEARDLVVSLVDPAREAEQNALIAAYDEVAATGFVDPFVFALRSFEIRVRHAPVIALRDAVTNRLPRALDLVVDWLDAHTSWATHDDRFRGANDAETRKNVERARECNPGFYEVRVTQLAAITGSRSWWDRSELAEERAGGRVLWTDPRVALALEAAPYCTPETPVAPAELVARAESFGPNTF